MDWGALAVEGLKITLGLLDPVLAVLLAKTALALARKFGMEASAEQDRQVYEACARAVNYAEEWAKKQPVKPLGNQKAQVALGALKDILDSKTFKEFGEPALAKLLDAGVKDANFAPQPEARPTVLGG